MRWRPFPVGKRSLIQWPMDIEDLVPKKPKGHEVGADLTKLSVGELQELIETLKTEIARVEQALAAKQSSKSAAESVFKR